MTTSSNRIPTTVSSSTNGSCALPKGQRRLRSISSSTFARSVHALSALRTPPRGIMISFMHLSHVGFVVRNSEIEPGSAITRGNARSNFVWAAFYTSLSTWSCLRAGVHNRRTLLGQNIIIYARAGPQPAPAKASVVHRPCRKREDSDFRRRQKCMNSSLRRTSGHLGKSVHKNYPG
jgi:hypothetical protein